ncbi:MAG: hypothetical protein U0R81_12960 [Mycobacterium sp.]
MRVEFQFISTHLCIPLTGVRGREKLFSSSNSTHLGEGVEMSTATAKSHFSIRNFQLTTATVAVVAATTLTPMVAQATPSLGPWIQGIGDSASLVVDPVVIPNSSFKSAASVAAADGDSCSGVRLEGVCYLVEGFVKAGQAIIDSTMYVVGSVTYVLIDSTGELFQIVGEVLPGPLGDVFVNVGEGISTVANDVAQNLHLGPYATSE